MSEWSLVRHGWASMTEMVHIGGAYRVFPRNNKVWAHGPMSMKFDGPFL